ncbi:MAG: hydroxymethylbilane synthase [Anaerolineae bacterium]
MPQVIVIGSRGSALALAQTHEVLAALRRTTPSLNCTTRIIQTQGDADQQASLAVLGGQGVFVKAIEVALEHGLIDLAIHSLKDVPSQGPPSLTLRPVLLREDPRDALVTRDGAGLRDLPPGARVGTGSLRREVQLRALCPDLRVVDIRGNVDTRLRKLDAGDYDAIVLAAAGLHRLGLGQRISAYLPLDQMLPAPGQGILAAETRADDLTLLQAVEALVDPATEVAATAERAFLARLGAGCRLPMAAYARVDLAANTVMLHAMVADPDGDGGRLARAAQDAPLADAGRLGTNLAEALAAEVAEVHTSA